MKKLVVSIVTALAFMTSVANAEFAEPLVELPPFPAAEEEYPLDHLDPRDPNEERRAFSQEWIDGKIDADKYFHNLRQRVR